MIYAFLFSSEQRELQAVFVVNNQTHYKLIILLKAVVLKTH